jgi:hypothetical protein
MLFPRLRPEALHRAVDTAGAGWGTGIAPSGRHPT